MLRITVCMSADGAEKYFDNALKRSDYYAEECGLWAGKGAERLGLKGEVERDQFVSLLRNVDPNTGERLTARTNSKREERRFDRATGQWTLEEKENRRAGYDLTFSVPKSLSIYLARTQDPSSTV